VLLISAIGCDRRKSLYKTLEKIGEVQFFEALEEGKGRCRRGNRGLHPVELRATAGR